ncbi:YtxH domain-containing protein [Marivirga sp. S37H4]|uniref:YtxH domain-containing protein n=1 Tax=Marivirga aurantiaca TaxID=2802615 RepID=A0A934WWM2_9BACT|nr:YtxH domain-containing protein [Marivirga aurantiaca]MBK6264277.1 YtxH domain-containing protein [Marivirga aurantiaca]
MEHTQNNGNGKVLAGLLIGAISGAALGILFAPSDGRKTRDKLSEEVNKMTHDFKEKLAQETESIRDRAMRLIGYTEAKAEKLSSEVKETTKDMVKEKASETSSKADNLKQNL